MQIDNNINSIDPNQSNITYLSNSKSNDKVLESDAMKIYVFQPNKNIRRIKLYSYNYISVLYHIYPAGSIFIFKGQILDSHYSFKYYQIIHDSKIIALSSHLIALNPRLIEKWQNETLDLENFEYKINLYVNENSRNELFRIKDIKNFKNELKRRRFGSTRKIFLSQNFDNGNINNQNIKLTIDYKLSDSPSCDPFPMLINTS